MAQTTRFGISGGIRPFSPDFTGKVRFAGQAVEVDTALPIVDFSIRGGTIGQAVEVDSPFPVTIGNLPLAITSVSSSRGTNIIAANETLTVNVTESAGVNIVTVNGVTTSLIQIITSTELTCVVPLGVGATYGSSVNVIADNGSPSPTFAATWQPPLGMVETDFTVDYANLDPDSPFAGDTTFSTLAAGDSCIYDAVTTPGGNSVSMDGLGEFTIGGTITAIQTFDYYIYDLSDNTVSSSIEQITVHPGPVEASIGLASETDTSFAVTSNIVTTAIIGQAVETDTSHPASDGSIPLQEIGQAAETDTAHPIAVGALIQTVVIGQAAEVDTSHSIIDASIPSQTIGLASETNTSFPVIDAQAVTRLIGIAAELNTALDVDFPATLDSLRDQIEALEDQITALTNLVTTQQLFIDDLYTRMDLNSALVNTYDDDGSLITNTDFTLTKTDNGDGTFDITRS